MWKFINFLTYIKGKISSVICLTKRITNKTLFQKAERYTVLYKRPLLKLKNNAFKSKKVMDVSDIKVYVLVILSLFLSCIN
jgi:hypothetical protein